MTTTATATATATITLSMRGADSLNVVQAVVGQMLRVDRAVKRIGATPRQLERLLIRYKEEGPAGLSSLKRGKRGKPSNRQVPAGLTEHAIGAGSRSLQRLRSDAGAPEAHRAPRHHTRVGDG